MEVNAQLVKQKRTQNNWTQQHLAEICGLSMRTIQRVERYGNASNETVSALASVLEVDANELIVPEIEVMTFEKPAKSPWVEKLSLIASSAVFGYIIAILTN